MWKIYVQRVHTPLSFVADAPLHRRKPRSVFFRSPTTSRPATLHAQKATLTVIDYIITPQRKKRKCLGVRKRIFFGNWKKLTVWD